MAKENAAELEQFKKIHPSLFIGLGGTGKHVLLCLRRKLFEKLGLKDGLPCMEFLWLDTDMQNIGIDGKELDYTLEQVKFQQKEIIDLQVPDATFKSYLSFKEDYPHIWEWLPHTIEAQGPPRNGAKQIRPLGRLGFFYKYDEIVKRLDFLKSKISSRDNINKTQEMGIEVDASKTDIYIVFSIAGGTGSGTFLDMAFTLKDHFISGVTTIGYVVLPSVFWHDKSHRIFANSYAALKELEYYSLRKDFLDRDEAMTHEMRESAHDFDCWYSAKSKKRKVVGPPFDVIYLIDNQTSQGFTINLDNKDQLMDMAAEDIFLQFASPAAFGSIIKSIQSNAHALLEQHYLFEILDEKREGSVKYSEAYSRHYASMGLAKIYIPVDKIRKNCSLKLAIDIVGNWLKKPTKAPNINDLVEKDFYSHLKLSKGETGKTFINRINKLGERNFEAAVDDWINRLRNRVIPKIERTDSSIRKELVDEVEEYIKENIKKEGTKKGIYVEGIDTNISNMVKEIQSGILEEMNEILNEPNFRFEIAKKMLLHLKERLDHMKQMLERHCNETRKKITGIYKRDFDTRLNTYAEVERRFTYLKKITLMRMGNIMIRKLRQWLINEVRVLLMEGAMKAIEEISGFVGFSKTKQDENGEIIVIEEGLVKKLSDVEEILGKDVLGSLNHKHKAFARQEEEHINIGIYDDQLIRSYYELEGKPVDDEVIYIKGKEFLAETSLEMIGFIDYFEKYGKGKLEESLEVFCSRRFSTLKKKHEAVRMLYNEKKYRPEDRKRMIGNFVGNGHPWIKPTDTFLGTGQNKLRKNIQKYSVLGVYPGKHDCYRQFETDVRAEKVEVVRFQITDSEENVAYFYTEWVAFPAMYIDGIREWHDRAYLDYMERGEEDLHIEKYYHKYDELIAISREDLNMYLSAYETLILGFILGIIEIAQEKERRTFGYNIELEAAPGIFRPKRIGDEYFAIKRLEREPRLKQTILDMIARKKTEIELDKEKLWNYYSLLKYYWTTVFPLKYKGSKADPVEIHTFEHRVIESEMILIGDKLEDRLKNEELGKEQINREIQENLKSRLADLDGFSRRVGDSVRRVLTH
ncbi:MAG: tubulin-like doman-containing protein [Candidatus Aminicenantes bacterium]|nr:MAG: tubulin-like doman-containing protein [Candidatus Aminicenantes bacterium]